MGESIPLEYSEFKKKLVKFNILFAEQQNSSKIRKKGSMSADLVTSVRKKMKDDSTMYKEFIIGPKKKFSGIISFEQNTQEYYLKFTIVNYKKNVAYSEILYLPIYVDINNLILKIKTFQNEYYSNLDNKSLQDYKALIILENQLLAYRESLVSSNINKLNIKLQTENEYLISLRSKYDDIKRLSGQERNTAINEYLKLNQSLNHSIDKNGNQLIYPGTYVQISEGTGILEIINSEESTYSVNVNGKTYLKNISEVTVLKSIRNSISETIIPNNYIVNIKDIFPHITDTTLLIEMLDINLKLPDINSRPKLEQMNINDKLKIPMINNKPINIIDNTNFNSPFEFDLLFDTEYRLYIGNKLQNLEAGHNKIDKIPENMVIGLNNWRSKLSINNMDVTFTIDDFEFNSIAHYHKASQFYNRTDLSNIQKMEYNDFFIKLTNNYKGVGSLNTTDPTILSSILSTLAFDRPINWYSNALDGDSLSSIYLKKAYYNKFNNNQELKTALINTYPAVIYERLSQNKYFINYELMLVRYYLYKNIKPKFENFNYDSSVYKNYILKTSETIVKHMEILLKIFVDNDVYDNKEKYYQTQKYLIDSYFREDITGELSSDNLLQYINELLFTYNSVYIYEKLEKYIMTIDGTRKITLDDFCKKNNMLTDKSFWIIKFYYAYINLRIKKQRDDADEHLLQMKSQQSILRIGEINELKAQYTLLRRKLKTMGYVIVDIPVRDLNVLDAIIEYFIRCSFAPFNFKTQLNDDINISNKTLIKNSIFDDNDYNVYDDAKDYLVSSISELYKLNNYDISLNLKDINLILKLVSRLMGIDITVITNESDITKIYLKDTLTEYPVNIRTMPNIVESIGTLVLANIYDTEYYFSTKPDFSQNRKIDVWLYEPKSHYLIDEIEGVNTVIGKWDPVNMRIDIKDKDPGEALNGELDIEDFLVYTINDRIYYKDREIFI